MNRFWRSAEGEATRLRRRRFESLRVDVALEPPTKRSRPGARTKARETLRAAFETDTLARHARALTNWPKPRAAIALDVDIFSTAKNSPRVDSVCKWLLDELAGKVYTDDRQVKLLFAHMWKTVPEPSHNGDDFSGASAVPASSGVTERSPRMFITAQTRASVHADLRAAASLDERWDPFVDDAGAWHREPLEAGFHRDELLDYRSLFDPNSEQDASEHRLLTHQIDFQDQAQQQRHVDRIFSLVLTGYQLDQLAVWSRFQSGLTYSPYSFNLGVLPERGGSVAFRQRLRATLQSRRAAYPGLFPLRARSGITMILFEEPGSGKDLDNLVRAALPEILDVLRPPQHDLPGWVAEEPDPTDGAVDIPFIEVAAVPAAQARMPPGSVVFGLSSGHRLESWWHHVGDYVERALDEDRWR